MEITNYMVAEVVHFYHLVCL